MAWNLSVVANFRNWAFCHSGIGENTQVTPSLVLHFSTEPGLDFCATLPLLIWNSFAELSSMSDLTLCCDLHHMAAAREWAPKLARRRRISSESEHPRPMALPAKLRQKPAYVTAAV